MFIGHHEGHGSPGAGLLHVAQLDHGVSLINGIHGFDVG